VAIRIVEGPEPLSAQALEAGEECILIESEAYRLLVEELRRYCRREVTGRSFLIAGHRGSGKTTMVSSAFLQVLQESKRRQTRLRPLLVQLHGPSLFPEPSQGAPGPSAAPPSAGTGTTRPKTDAELALEQITLGLHRAVAREFSAAFRAAFDVPVVREQSWWQKLIGIPIQPVRFWSHAALAELAAAFEVELYEGPTAARLRWYWNHANLDGVGILGFDGRDPMRQIVALSGVCDAYRRISGTYELEEKLKDEAKRELQRTLGIDSKDTALFTSLVSLLTGGLVGTGLFAAAAAGGPASTVGGVLSALAAAGILKYSTTRSGSRAASREYRFIFDLSAATLDRVLPVLIERLQLAGLAPIFVVDELDKVKDLSSRILGMVHHLKKLVAENAFFCFLTDRTYFEGVVRRGATIAYPVEYTYFTHQLFVAFSPCDFHAYIQGHEAAAGAPVREGVLRVPRPPAPPGTQATPAPSPTPPPASVMSAAGSASATAGAPPPPPTPGATLAATPTSESTDLPLLSYMLLHRSRMHAIDLRREIALLRDDDGNVALSPGTVRTDRTYRLDVQIQLAVEMVLDSVELRAKLERDPSFRRTAHDGLYFLSRRWADPGAAIDLTDGALPGFGTYLTERVGTEGTQPATASGLSQNPVAPQPVVVPVVDQDFLFGRVRRLATLLSDPAAYKARFKEWNAMRSSSGLRPVDQTVVDALMIDTEYLLEPDAAHLTFRWRFDTAGGSLGAAAGPQAAAPPIQPWRDDLMFVQGFAAVLAEVVR
jgi:hypothetical protein